MSSNDIVRLNVGGTILATSLETLLSEKTSLLAQWFDPTKINNPPLPADRNGAYFVDRDPETFKVILNYLRLRCSKQLWEACLPKDPDRLALLTQEAEYFRLSQLREGAIGLLHVCTERNSDNGYINQLMVKSTSCPMGFINDQPQ